MVSGKLRCLGSGQQLKDRYGRGYSLFIKATPEKLDAIHLFVREVYPAAKLLREVWGSLEFEIPQDQVNLPALFETIENRREALDITDYSVSQTSLEQVFLRFAQEQATLDERKDHNNISNGRRNCCSCG
jgi:hypothetical protein